MQRELPERSKENPNRAHSGTERLLNFLLALSCGGSGCSSSPRTNDGIVPTLRFSLQLSGQAPYRTTSLEKNNFITPRRRAIHEKAIWNIRRTVLSVHRVRFRRIGVGKCAGCPAISVAAQCAGGAERNGEAGHGRHGAPEVGKCVCAGNAEGKVTRPLFRGSLDVRPQPGAVLYSIRFIRRLGKVECGDDERIDAGGGLRQCDG